ncbi:DUF6328 family protein [Streptomyces sp. NPDC058548]|uniref:DUF6328 family protein n=1 Tax=unclassified Streptomyces TaxID=2593676 RepID=UPI003655BF6B
MSAVQVPAHPPTPPETPPPDVPAGARPPIDSPEAQAKFDKAYAELLQEVRVAQTGVQFLLGFLMTLAFTPRFQTLSVAQEYQYVLTLMLAFAAAALLTTPAPFHRVVFRHGLKHRLLSISHGLAIVGLVLLMLSMTSALLLVVAVVLGAAESALVAAVVFSGTAWLWFGMPLWQRLRHGRE